MTPEQIESELKYLATKEDIASVRIEITSVRTEIAKLEAMMHKELANQLKWIIALQLPTWLGIIGILLRK